MAVPSEFWSRWRVRTGYPLALVFLWLAAPAPRSLVLGGAIAALGLLVRGAAAGHLHKHEGLAVSGPYSRTRNPLYLGSAVLALGFAVAGRSWWGAALMAVYLLLFYPAVMRREGEELRAHYGRAFEDYAARVPLFWPRWGRANAGAGRFSWELYRRNREYQAALGALGALGLLVLRMYWRG